MAYGIYNAKVDVEDAFETRAIQLVRTIQTTWNVYERTTLNIHNYCRRLKIGSSHGGNGTSVTGNALTRLEFYQYYQYILAGGLEFESMQCSPNVTHDQRQILEDESRRYYETYYPDDVQYGGMTGFIINSTTGQPQFISPSPERDVYFPVHYLEPVVYNAPAIELDMYSFPSQKNEIDLAVSTNLPVLSKRLQVVNYDELTYSVIIYHPGVVLETDPEDYVPSVLSLILVRIPSLLGRVARVQEESLAVYLHDSTPMNIQAPFGNNEPEFLGGGAFFIDEKTGEHRLELLHEITLDELDARYGDNGNSKSKKKNKKNYYQEEIGITPSGGTWIVSVVPIDDTYEPQLGFIIFGGVMILVAGMVVACWYFTNSKRNEYLQELRFKAEKEKAQLIVENAENTARAERELNDFLAHEVRNPLAAAISACSFVKATLTSHQQQQQLKAKATIGDEEEKLPLVELSADTNEQLLDDVNIISSSLSYVNDLLRNMLDMHKSSSDQMRIVMKPACLELDILEPVATMIYQNKKSNQDSIDHSLLRSKNSSSNSLKDLAADSTASKPASEDHNNDTSTKKRVQGVTVEVKCDPKSLMVLTDQIRLKQIVLNLATNSCKFVEHGFIRIGAYIDEPEDGGTAGGTVCVYVEDSGPGIPEDKRLHLFDKFQTSLDSLSQGTGFGLALCKNLSQLLGGDIELDESFNSGISGCPGSRFVVKLNVPPILQLESNDSDVDTSDRKVDQTTAATGTPDSESASNGSATTAVGGNKGVSNSGSDGSLMGSNSPLELPSNYKVLFVDDDLVLRKLFARSVKRVAPTWDIHEASNVETAIRLVQELMVDAPEKQFDILFLDQYMASVQKQLLGTETCRDIRICGYKGIICGLSANDLELQFLQNGANVFMMKPFPCEIDKLKSELKRVIYQHIKNDTSPGTVITESANGEDLPV